MSNINKQALREKFEAWAEEAGALPWGILKQHRNQDGSYPGPHYTYMWNAWDACHEVLLDELEAKDKSINFLKERLAQLANFNPDWDALEAATDSLREHMEELTTARSRIAELEAREVKLPELKMLSDYLQEVTMREREDILLGVKLEFHRELQAAVIRINGEG